VIEPRNGHVAGAETVQAVERFVQADNRRIKNLAATEWNKSAAASYPRCHFQDGIEVIEVSASRAT
jgi:hypothetical protein